MSRWRSRVAEALDAVAAVFPPLEEAYVPARARIVLEKYRRRRDRYAEICRMRGLTYHEAQTSSHLEQRLGTRGYRPAARRIGEIHTFAFIPRIGWHDHLYQGLRALGPVTEFDYAALGYRWSAFQQGGRRGLQQRQEMNARVLPVLEAAHRKRPVDWVFVYASGLEISADLVGEIERRVGVPTVNMCLDDKQSWEGLWMGDHRAGQVDIARAFDLSWTSARVACEWYLAEGGRPLYLPPGCDPDQLSPRAVPQDIDVSFVGQRYGFRRNAIRFLERMGVNVETFGRGWPQGQISDEAMIEIFCRSHINLGFGGIGAAEALTNVKARDFDVPCTGGGVYLTSFNPDLALHFDVGREIVCYRSRDEMLELIRYHLARPDEARRIAVAARARCLREHLWTHRYVRVCQVLGLLEQVEPAFNPASRSLPDPPPQPCAD